mgnify:CR=1 FL=1
MLNNAQRKRRWGMLALLGFVGVLAWLWLTMLSPWFYDRPDDVADIEQRTHQVFVYGTLTYAPIRWLVMGANGQPSEARLENYRKNGLDLSFAENAHVDGLRLTVTPEQLRRLDRYERLGVRYTRQEMTLADGSRAWVYRRLADSATILDQLDDPAPLIVGDYCPYECPSSVCSCTLLFT